MLKCICVRACGQNISRRHRESHKVGRQGDPAALRARSSAVQCKRTNHTCSQHRGTCVSEQHTTYKGHDPILLPLELRRGRQREICVGGLGNNDCCCCKRGEAHHCAIFLRITSIIMFFLAQKRIFFFKKKRNKMNQQNKPVEFAQCGELSRQLPKPKAKACSRSHAAAVCCEPKQLCSSSSFVCLFAFVVRHRV
jgi:hypothetical protein